MRVLGNVSAIVVLVCAGSAGAITVTRTDVESDIQTALLAGGVGINNVTTTIVSSHTSGESNSIGTYTNGTNTYGIGPGVVISTGDVGNYSDGPNANDSQTTQFQVLSTPGQEALLDPITGGGLNHGDVTQIDIMFDMAQGFNAITFDITWGSEEFNEFIDSEFIDAFGLYVNGTNIAFVDGAAVNVNHPFVGTADGTELDGVLSSGDTNSVPEVGGGMPTVGSLVHTFIAGVNPTDNQLTIIIADSFIANATDFQLDSTAFISQLGGTIIDGGPGPGPGPGPGAGPGNPSGNAVPEPVTAALGMIGLAVLGAGLRRRSIG